MQALSSFAPETNRRTVRDAFNDPSAYAAQRAIHRTSEGPDATELALGVVDAIHPRRVLEIGCGFGEFAERVSLVGAQLVALDIAPAMVQEARSRGVDARVGDAEALGFADATFDCVIANWVLHYLPAPERALAEVARVLLGGGVLIAATLSERHLGEVWSLLFGTDAIVLSFSRENAAALLERHFNAIHRFDVDGTVVFPGHRSVKAHVARSIGGGPLAARVPKFEGSFKATRRASVFVAWR
jgi:SAM-dependent methyltransferase